MSSSSIATSCKFNGILRAPERRRFLLIGARRAEQFMRSLQREFPVVVCDLSHGPSRHHHIAYELAEQLGVALPKFNHFDSNDNSTQNIENELRGNLDQLSALALANSLAKILLAGAFRIVVFMPAKRYEWAEANIAFVEFIADALYDRTPRIVLVHNSSDPRGGAPKGWRFINARLPRQKAVVGAKSASRSCRHLLVQLKRTRTHDRGAVAARLTTASGHANRFERHATRRLARSAPSTPKRKKTAQQLIQSANEAAAQGDLAFAITQAENAYRVARNGIESAGALYNLQIQQIRAAQFNEAAREILPLDVRDPNVLRQLLCSTGYAAAMDGDPEIAKWYLLAAAPRRPPCEWRDLFARNALALALARCGAGDTAFKLLHGIMEHDATNWHLRSICLLNTARLHRTQGSMTAAADAFRRWGRIIDGNCIEGEFLSKSVYLARHGQNETAFDVLCQWMRAAIHWLANPAPECISWRIASALQGGKEKAANVDKICRTIARELTKTAGEAGVRIGKSAIAPTYAYVSDRRGLYSSSLVAIDGPQLGLLASDFRQLPFYDSVEHRQLRQMLANLLLALVGPLAVAQTYYLDASDGYDIPSGTDETVNPAARHGACAIVSRKGIRSFDAAERVQRELNSHVGPSAAVERLVDDCDGVKVEFKRHWPPIVLTRTQARLIERIGGGIKLGTLGSPARSLVKTVRELERSRVLQLRWNPA